MSDKKPTYQDLEKQIAELKLEKKLKQSEDRFNALLQASEDMITIHKPNGKYVYYNGPKCYAITSEDIVGKMPNDLFDIEVSSKLFNAFRRVEKTGVSETLEVLLDWLGEKRWFSEYIYPIKNNDGKVLELVKVCRDIHQRKIAELKLEEQHKDKKRQAKELQLFKEKAQITLDLLERRKYSMNEASKIAKIGYWEHDIITNKVIWSDFVYHIFEKKPKDGIPLQEEIFEKFDHKSRKKLEKVTTELLSKGTPYDVELKWINSKEKVVWIRNVAQPIYNQQNKIVGKRGVMQNITDSKNTQHNLELSKQKIQNTLELVKENEYSLKEAGRMAKIGYWRFDNLTENLFWSDALYQMYGSDPELGVPSVEAILSVYTKESRKRIIEALENLTKKGIPYDIELEFTNFKNEKRWIRNIGEPIYNDDNENVGRRGISQDITQKKRNETNLDQQNKKLNELNNALNQAQKLSHVGSWQWNMKTDKAEWSDEMYNIYGVSKDSFYPSNENVSKMMLSEDLYKKEEGINTLMVDKMFVPFEFRIKRPSGEIRHLYIMALEKNSQESVFGVTKDITEQKLIEEENLRIQENYIRLFDNASVSIWNEDFSMVFDKIDELKKLNIPDITKYLEEYPEVLFSLLENLKVNNVNKATLKLFKAKSNEEFLHNITETFAEGADKVFIKLIEAIWCNKKTFTSEVNYKTLEGDEFTAIISIAIPQTKIEQKTVPVNIQSIQNLKDAELDKRETLNSLKESQEMYRLLSDNSNDLICLQESDSRFKYISPSIKNLLGYEQSDFLGRKVFSIVHKDDIERLKDTMNQNVFSSLNSKPFIIRIRHKKGHFVWFEFLSSPVYKNNEINYFVTTARDITQSMLAKQEIQEYQTALQKMTTEMTLIEENHKKEIASNIHDHLSQSLVISKMKINELKKNPKLNIINEDLIFIEKHISEVLENSRKITYELSPPVLYQLGIVEALNWLLEDVEATHKIKCQVISNVSNLKLSDVKSILLYRSIQELLKNVVKYANASLINLEIDKTDLGVNILLKDNGGGFNTSILNSFKNQSGSGFGLFAVQERINNIQGEFTITSKINKGTSVNIFIPLL